MKSDEKVKHGLDLDNYCTVYSGGRVEPWVHLEGLNLAERNLSALNLMFASYGEDTVWPSDKSKLPPHFDAKKFLEYRKDFGLNITNLHKSGIIGTGRAIAVISTDGLKENAEFEGRVRFYEEIKQPNEKIGYNGVKFVSALVGKSCGIAVGADVYYYAIYRQGRSQVNYAKALQKVCDLHEKLKTEGKNGIDVVCIQAAVLLDAFKDDEGALETRQAIIKATELGIWINSGYLRFNDKILHEQTVCCKTDGDVNNPDDYVLPYNPYMRETPQDEERQRKILCFPAGCHTVAGVRSENSYVFDACHYYIKAYESGLFVLARSIKNNLSGEEFWELALQTGDYKPGIGVIVNPQKLIANLK